MNIIDAHIHIGDIYTGIPVKQPLSRLPFGLTSINEILGFKRPFPEGVDSENRLTGDIAFMESCRRAQFSIPERYIDTFKENGISHAVVLPIEPNVSTSYVLEIAGKYKEFIPFASVDFNSPDYILSLRNYMSSGCKGIKIHPVLQKIHPEDKRIYNLLEEFAEYNLPVYFHSGPARVSFVKTEIETYAHPRNFLKILGDFPKINFIFAHMGLKYYDAVIEMSVKYKNLFFDTSFQSKDKVLKAFYRAGPERIIYGSDFPLSGMKAPIKVLKAVIKDKKVLKMIFAENISKLMRVES